jgi:Na+-transporting NADH:ubiquinone oxidoreductase subunit B
MLGEMIFGGRGYGFVSPAVVALCLTVFSCPQVQLSAPSQTVALAVLPGAVLLLLLGLISGRVILGVFAGVAAAMLLTGADIDVISIGTALSFGLIFLICDPTAAAATNPGRWLYGILSGALAVLFAAGGSLTPESVVFAAMMASVFAPLVDHLVVLAHSRWRRTANG